MQFPDPMHRSRSTLTLTTSPAYAQPDWVYRNCGSIDGSAACLAGFPASPSHPRIGEISI